MAPNLLPEILITTSLPDAMAIIGQVLKLGDEPQDRCPACGMPVAADGPHALAQIIVTCTVGWIGNLPFLLCEPCAMDDPYCLDTVSKLLETALAEVTHARNVDRLAMDALARRN